MQSLTTISAPLSLARLADAEAAIDVLGNPAAPTIRAALDQRDPDDPDGEGTHFASLHAIRSADGLRGYLLLEYSGDGPQEAALTRIVTAMEPELRAIFALASDWTDGVDLTKFLRSHIVRVGAGVLDPPGLTFSGTPGLTVGRILTEQRLAAEVARILAAQPGGMHALDRLAEARRVVGEDASLASALAPATPEEPFERPPIATLAVSYAVAFVATYLWPVPLLVLAWGLGQGALWGATAHGFWRGAFAFLGGFLSGTWAAAWVALAGLVVVGLAIYVALRRAEDRDAVDERVVDPAVNAAMFARENVRAQNHMISVTERKPGFVRAVTLRLIFWVIGKTSGTYYRPGFLGQIGTIHFARWVTLPGGRDLIFLSNYGGSWESYLEDFITRAHAGLTGVWSNCLGFPRSENLVGRGATDGERFKRYARHSMVPTRFWYRAYPDLTTTEIRANAEIRRGLSGAMTEDEAVQWLALFGSAPRPDVKLVSSEIQSLVFGGLKFKPHGACLILDLPDDVTRARAWLSAIGPDIAFNDGRQLKHKAVLTVAFGARGLAWLGLPTDARATFPFAFQAGMPARAGILGDLGSNAPETWWWGRTQPDVAVLVYGKEPEDAAELEARVLQHADAVGMAAGHRIPLAEVDKTKPEPFGFADGISQPVIRGTYKGRRDPGTIHLVEPGEFVLGYPDNRGNHPPGPELRAVEDPDNLLTLRGGSAAGFARTLVETPRDIGFNGSFLVIRQLEQDVDGFNAYCESESARLQGRLQEPYEITPDFVGAKLVGRWQDGSSLVRHPYLPRPAELARYEDPKAAADRIAAAAGTAPAGTSRAPTNPAAGTSIPAGPASRSRKDNDFLFGTDDPEALRCPFGAHIRRANPRDSLDPGSQDQIDISNRHRIMRVGRLYAPTEGQRPGLLFMCLNGDIERQFEFLQQSWLRSPTFHGLSCEKDPLLGDADEGACGFTIPTRDGPISLKSMPQFVTTRGGGYFFLPGRRLIEYLSAPPP